MSAVHVYRVDPAALRRLIAERDLSLTDFAHAAEVSYRHLMAVTTSNQSRRKGLSERLAVRFALILNVSVEDFTVPDTQASTAA